ncbi:hypothetical protein PHYPSEUDO_003809 [Phytophthora pseudosyringae]|uniref:Uncharacterized protein n=1 Tax=Phytophthora pseudosyringae TaxID=221518 RepID=A0A8T1WHB5_9STRA|nr:hypothetical protein PHYPSEUDO_003809 [Phytophthora pseudosyringae]
MAVAVLSVPERRKDAPANSKKAGDFALLLVQEWLVACKLESTARCLVDECARSERHIPARMGWNRMVESLGFRPRSPATGAKRSGGDTTVLEAVVRRATEQHEKDVAQTMHNQTLMPQQQVVLMSKKKELRFVSKKSLPRSLSAAPSNNAPDRSPQLSSSSSALGFRPKSAMVYKSTSDLTSRGESLKNSGSRPSISSGAGSFVKRKVGGTSQRPISAASVLTPHRDPSVRKRTVPAIGTPPSRSPTSSSALFGAMEAVAAAAVDAAATKTVGRHSSSVVGLRASLPHITEVAGPITSPGADESDRGDAKGIPKQDEDECDVPTQRAPKLSLEEMSEERLMEQFGSISRCALKKLRRVLTKSHACSQEFEKSQRTLDKIKARAKLRQLRRVLAEEQTPLLTSTMASLTTEPCSLCLYVFPKTTLTTKVSYKSIVDLRASWAVASGTVTSIDVANNDSGVPQRTAEGMNHARMTHLYDEAPVCAFCSQLVLNYPSYRPTSAERRAQHARERRETVQSLKDLEAKERHDLEKCDPLDYHSYELNSDDDDSGVEEVVEVQTDGRPQVIRRQRRQTMRTPVQLGVVSKRLHYDHLRSDSLHMLTLDEWQKIIR